MTIILNPDHNLVSLTLAGSEVTFTFRDDDGFIAFCRDNRAHHTAAQMMKARSSADSEFRPTFTIPLE